MASAQHLRADRARAGDREGHDWRDGVADDPEQAPAAVRPAVLGRTAVAAGPRPGGHLRDAPSRDGEIGNGHGRRGGDPPVTVFLRARLGSSGRQQARGMALTLSCGLARDRGVLRQREDVGIPLPGLVLVRVRVGVLRVPVELAADLGTGPLLPRFVRWTGSGVGHRRAPAGHVDRDRAPGRVPGHGALQVVDPAQAPPEDPVSQPDSADDDDPPEVAVPRPVVEEAVIQVRVDAVHAGPSSGAVPARRHEHSPSGSAAQFSPQVRHLLIAASGTQEAQAGTAASGAGAGWATVVPLPQECSRDRTCTQPSSLHLRAAVHGQMACPQDSHSRAVAPRWTKTTGPPSAPNAAMGLSR